VFANGAEAGRDPLAITPGLERIAPELLALVADYVFWRGTCVNNGCGPHLFPDRTVSLV